MSDLKQAGFQVSFLFLSRPEVYCRLPSHTRKIRSPPDWGYPSPTQQRSSVFQRQGEEGPAEEGLSVFSFPLGLFRSYVRAHIECRGIFFL